MPYQGLRLVTPHNLKTHRTRRERNREHTEQSSCAAPFIAPCSGVFGDLKVLARIRDETSLRRLTQICRLLSSRLPCQVTTEPSNASLPSATQVSMLPTPAHCQLFIANLCLGWPLNRLFPADSLF